MAFSSNSAGANMGTVPNPGRPGRGNRVLRRAWVRVLMARDLVIRARSNKGENLVIQVRYLFAFVTILGAALACATPAGAASDMPPGFVYAEEVIPGLQVDLRYSGSNNFMGRPVEGYEGKRLILTRPAAERLAKVQQELAAFGLSLLVYDGYRPQRAVDQFVRWAQDLDDQLNKATYYPYVDKSRLLAAGYIADRSGHSRGSTIDLTLVDATTGEPLDMGTPWDYFGPESWPDYRGLEIQHSANRLLLQSLMQRNGFVPYQQEWWHFTLADEPYPDTYFDFTVR